MSDDTTTIVKIPLPHDSHIHPSDLSVAFEEPWPLTVDIQIDDGASVKKISLGRIIGFEHDCRVSETRLVLEMEGFNYVETDSIELTLAG